MNGKGDEERAGLDEPTGPSAPPRRRRLSVAVLLAAGVGLLLYFSRGTPREHEVRFVLGDAAPKTTDLVIEYGSPEGELSRRTELHYAPGTAPRIVSQTPKLADGPYRIRIDLVTPPERRTVERTVELEGARTTIDLGGAAP